VPLFWLLIIFAIAGGVAVIVAKAYREREVAPGGLSGFESVAGKAS
jgi:hypothetical protein